MKKIICLMILPVSLMRKPLWADAPATIQVDVSQTGHVVSPLIFGDQIQWPGFGQDLLAVTSAAPSTTTLRTDVLDQLRPAGMTLLRYPGGTLSDFFHWNVSTGSYVTRAPLMTLDLQSGSTYQYQTQLPIFGADEFAQTAQYLGTEMMITANVGTGTAPEAANWLAYYESQGIKPKYWEIGNEVYLPGNTPSGNALLDDVHVSALQYAAIFDAYASALRAVDPSVQVGLLGVHVPAPGLDTWDQIVLQNIHQKADFMAVHNSYAPQGATSDTMADIYAATLAYPVMVRSNLDLIEQDIAAFAPAASSGMAIAITEHAALFTPAAATSDFTSYLSQLARSQSLGGALYSALLFNLYLRDSRVQIANHINPLSPYFQALLQVQLPNIPGVPGYNSSQPLYPLDYTPNPIQSAYFHVFQLYSETSHGSTLSATVTNSPTFNTTAVTPEMPALSNVPSLDVLSVQMPAPSSQLYLYVVNRDLSSAIPAAVLLNNLSSPVQLQAIDQLTSSDYRNFNSESNPSEATLAQVNAGGLPGGTYVFPAASLTRFTFILGAIQNLDGLAIYPNPLRPAMGHAAMHFDNLPAGSRLRIYTLAGEKVKDLTADATGHALWDGTNQASEKCASGIYFVYVQGAGNSKTLKVAIQR